MPIENIRKSVKQHKKTNPEQLNRNAKRPPITVVYKQNKADIPKKKK